MNRLLVVSRNDHFPALSDGAHGTSRQLPAPVESAARPFLQVVGRAAPHYDATADRWIVPPPGVTPVAGASAEQGHTQAANTLVFQPRPRPPASPKTAGGHLRHAIAECLTTAFGLLVFSLIAWAFLVLA